MEREPADRPATPTCGPNAHADFETFWEKNYPYCLSVLIFVGASYEDAEDVVQEVIKDILEKRRWGTLTHPKAWVRKAALHTYYDWRYRERRRPELEIKGQLTPEGYVDDGLNIWEDQQWVERMLSRLPPTQRRMFELVIADFKPSEIADLLGKKADAVRQNLRHARNSLRAALCADYSEPDDL